jgi:hypothetical protein
VVPGRLREWARCGERPNGVSANGKAEARSGLECFLHASRDIPDLHDIDGIAPLGRRVFPQRRQVEQCMQETPDVRRGHRSKLEGLNPGVKVSRPNRQDRLRPEDAGR